MAAVWLRHLVLAAFIVLLVLPVSAFAATMDYLGTWSSSTTYATGKVVKHNGGIFYSLKSSNSAPNRNKPPGANPTWREPIGSAVKPWAVYDATGTFIGVVNNGWLTFTSGSQQVVMNWGRNGFYPDCTESSSVCVPSAANNYLGNKVYTTRDCSGTAYYYLDNDVSRGRTYGTSSGGVVSFDAYFPTNETIRTISSYYVGQIEGCQRMNYGGLFKSPSVSAYVNDGAFTKVTVSGLTAPFFVK
jgi:hypothetical protein